MLVVGAFVSTGGGVSLQSVVLVEFGVLALGSIECARSGCR